eukprot:gene8289-9172_t
MANGNVEESSEKGKGASRFQWKQGEKVANLMECLANYRTNMQYNNSDFNADNVKLYEAVREAMAKIYMDKPTLFRPPKIREICEAELLNENRVKELHQLQKVVYKRGYSRVQEKLKEIRQNIFNAVTTASRSGNGKIIFEHYEQLKKIWGGSPSTNPLPCGISTEELSPEEISPPESSHEDEDQFLTGPSDIDVTDSSTGDSQPTVSQSVCGRKQKLIESPAPRLIDNKISGSLWSTN